MKPIIHHHDERHIGSDHLEVSHRSPMRLVHNKSMRSIAILLLLLALLRPNSAARIRQPRTRGGAGAKTSEDVNYGFESSEANNAVTAASNDKGGASHVNDDDEPRERTKTKDSQSGVTALERAKSPLTEIQAIESTNTGGAKITMSRNETLADDMTSLNQEQIVGGTSAALGSYSFYVHGASPTDDTRICGGALVHPDIFLTTASCQTVFFLNRPVFIGATNLLSTLGFAESRIIAVKRVHPSYRAVSGENDLMIVKLDTRSSKDPVDFNTFPNFPTTGESLKIVGFGWTDADEEVLSPNLQQATINAVDFERCVENNNLAVSEESQICAGQSTGGPDSW